MPESIDNSFLTVVGEIEKGRIACKAAEGLAELLRACQDLGKSGTLTLKITVAPVPESVDDEVEILADVTVKAPKAKPKRTIFYALPDGRLTRTNPHQQEFPFTAAAEEAAPVSGRKAK